jgi:hypothetical protein
MNYVDPLGLDGEDDNDPMTMGNGIVFIDDSDLFIAGSFFTVRGFTLLESGGPRLETSITTFGVPLLAANDSPSSAVQRRVSARDFTVAQFGPKSDDNAIAAAVVRGDIQQLRTMMEIATPAQRKLIAEGLKKLNTPVRDLIRGKFKRSKSYRGELDELSYKELIDLDKTNSSDATKQMLKLIKESQRLQEKLRGSGKY